MKKTNLLKGALSVLAVSVLLASCTQVDSKIDTVDTLETPSVKAVAYPGVNYISWNAVKGAANYKVTRTVDGGVETLLDSLGDDGVTSDLYITDSLSVNDVDVEYKVYALSTSNPSRSVYVYDSNAGSASVTNIFPPVGTKAIDLPKYEKDSGWNFDEGADNKDWKDDFIPTAENIKVQLVDGAIHVTAPTKAYLSTRVVGYTGNKEEIFYYDYPTRTEIEFNEYQNKTLSKKSVIKSAGEYKFKATVNALGEWYRNAYYGETIFALNTTITIPSIETSKATQITLVDYIDDAKTTARIEFMPAVSKDGTTTFAVADYKVYRALAGSNDLVEVKDLKADSRTINGKTEVVYYVEDKVPSNKVAYDYYVVLSKDNKFESTNKSRRLETPNFDQTNSGWIRSWTFNKFDDDKLENDLVFEVGNNYSNTKIVSVAYAYSTTNDTSKVLDTAYKPLTVIDEVTVNYNQQAFLVPNVPENNYVIVKAEFADKDDSNKTNYVLMGVSPKYEVADIDTSNFNVQISNPIQKKGDDLLNNDWLNNKIKIPAGTELVSVKYATAKTVELARTAALNSKDTVAFKVNDYKDGGYYWQYEFDINDKGKVGEYLAVAVEIKDENNKKAIYLQSNNNPVTINYNDCILKISRTDKGLDGTTKNVTTLTADVSLDFNTSENNVKNYGEACLYWIETNSSYEISPTAEWKSEKITIEPETNEDSATFTKSINIASYSYDYTKDNKNVDKFYVIKLVTKYTIDGAEEKEDSRKYQFNYNINK